MARFRMLRLIVVPLMLLAGCGGGRSGTGISESVADLVASQPSASDAATTSEEVSQSVLSMIEGNVARVNLALRHSPKSRQSGSSAFASLLRLLPFGSVANAGGGVDGIRVSAEGTDATTETDTEGAFSLSGPFSGPTVLRFERLEDGIDSAMIVRVPKGGSLSLRDLTIDGSSTEGPSGNQLLSFDGTLEDKDCLQRQMQVVSRFDTAGESYLVDLVNSSVTDAAGNRVSCIQLRKGDAAHIEGAMQPDGTIAGGNVIIEQEKTIESAAAAVASGLMPKPPPAPNISVPPSLPVAPDISLPALPGGSPLMT